MYRRVSRLLPALLFISALRSETVAVRYPQGSAHGFLVVKTLRGNQIATGDVIQTLRGDLVTSHLVLHFKDGSLDDELTVFTQRGHFKLISDHLIQHGPSFPKSVNVKVNASTGQITSHNEDGSTTEEHLDLPPDVSNGLPPNLLLNISPSTPETKLSFVVPGKKPRLIHISIKPAGRIPFTVGGTRRKAVDYVLHVELGGIVGVLAPLVGKQPDDYHIWILSGASPAFIREEGQLFEDGPVWRIEQVSPTFTP